MEMENIIKLIQTVSGSALTSFEYTEGDSTLSFKIDRNVNNEEFAKMKTSILVNEVSVGNEKTNSENQMITSPMVGVFYAAKSEDSAPYISVGDVVKKGQVIGIVEAMKLMNEIQSPYDGVVEEILVKNKDIVEYGQSLVSLRPDSK